MCFPVIDLRAEGIAECTRLLNVLQRLGSSIKAANLRGLQRSGGNEAGAAADNAEVFGYLADGGRDFCGPTDGDEQAAAVAYIEAVRPRLESISAATAAGVQAQADSINVQGWMAAMKAWMARIKARLDVGVAADGSRRPVTEEYAARRRQLYGVPDDVIGKATGQCADNIDPGGTGARAISIGGLAANIGTRFGKLIQRAGRKTPARRKKK